AWGRVGRSVREECGARGEDSARSGGSLLSGSTTLGSRRGARERGFTVMQKSRNTVAGVSLLAGIAICSLASFADVTAARAQDNNAALLPQGNAVAPPTDGAAHAQGAAEQAGGGAVVYSSQLPPHQLVNVGVFRNVPAEAAKPIGQPVTSTDCRMSARPGHPYFVEFRSRTAA